MNDFSRAKRGYDTFFKPPVYTVYDFSEVDGRIYHCTICNIVFKDGDLVVVQSELIQPFKREEYTRSDFYHEICWKMADLDEPPLGGANDGN